MSWDNYAHENEAKNRNIWAKETGSFAFFENTCMSFKTYIFVGNWSSLITLIWEIWAPVQETGRFALYAGDSRIIWERGGIYTIVNKMLSTYIREETLQVLYNSKEAFFVVSGYLANNRNARDDVRWMQKI